MNDENEGHKNGGWGNLQIPFSLCPLRSFAAIQFPSSGLSLSRGLTILNSQQQHCSGEL
jgi:hypothetical protein